MKTETGYTYLNPLPGTVRVPIPQHHFASDPKVNYPFRIEMNNWLRDNCWHTEYEYPDEVCIYPTAVYIDEDMALVFRLMFS